MRDSDNKGRDRRSWSKYSLQIREQDEVCCCSSVGCPRFGGPGFASAKQETGLSIFH